MSNAQHQRRRNADRWMLLLGRVLSLPDMVRRPAITERALRPIAQVESPKDQLARFREVIADTV